MLNILETSELTWKHHNLKIKSLNSCKLLRVSKLTVTHLKQFESLNKRSFMNFYNYFTLWNSQAFLLHKVIDPVTCPRSVFLVGINTVHKIPSRAYNTVFLTFGRDSHENTCIRRVSNTIYVARSYDAHVHLCEISAYNLLFMSQLWKLN